MDKEKVKEIIHYIIYLTNKTPEKFGKTKLHKTLWFFEGIMYWKTGKKPINGNFVKNNFGPTLQGLDKILKELEQENKIKMKLSMPAPDYYQWLIKAITPPQVKLSPEEKEILAFLTNRFSVISATKLSKKTHTPYFQRKKYGEKLNSLSFLSYFKVPPTVEDIEWAKKELEAIREKRESPTISKLREKIAILQESRK